MRYFLYYAFLFLLGGQGYCTLEILSRGRTHYSMFFAGGIILMILVFISSEMKKAHLLKKCLLGAAIITAVEFVFGVIFNMSLNMNVWDYNGVPFNILGQICLPYSILWFGICFILFKWILKDEFISKFQA
ncbi:MAG: putative ABC transporter permease [Eubacterium sp.]|nr:putative ABC transporter permease [Eubacterium sp.]